MRNLKRALSLVMAMALIVGMMVVSASTVSKDFTDSSEIQHKEAVNTMVALNVISGKEDGSYYDPAGTLTRAEMAKIISYVMNGGVEPVVGTKVTPTYSDIKGHWAEAYIEYCTSMGIINGDGAGKFNPGGTLTAEQAAKMFLTAMGYNAKVFGFVGNDWAMNVGRYANEAGLYKELGDIVASQPITRDNAAQMAYNAIQATMMRRTWSQDMSTGQLTETYAPWIDTTTTSSGVSYSTAHTLFSEKFNGISYEGVLTASGEYGIGSSTGAKESLKMANVDKVNGVSTTSASFPNSVKYEDVTNLVGQYVKVLMNRTTNEVYGVYAVAEKNTVSVVTTVDKITYDATDAEIDVDGTSYDFDAGNIVYTNGTGATAVSSAFSGTARASGDTARVIDNDGDGEIDLVLIETIALGKVNYVGTDSFSITKLAGTRGQGTGVGGYTNANQKFADVIAPSNLAKDNYVVVSEDFYSKTDKYEVVTPVSATVNGTKDGQWMLNDTWFKPFSGDTTDNLSTSMKGGETVDYIAFGGITYYAAKTSDVATLDNIALVVTADKTGGAGNITAGTEKAVLMLANGTKTTVETVDVNGDQASATGLVGKMVSYTTTSGGKYILTEITGAVGTDFDSYVKAKVAASGSSTSIAKVGTVDIADDAVVFVMRYKTGVNAANAANDATVLTGKEVKTLTAGTYNTNDVQALVSNINGFGYVKVMTLFNNTPDQKLPDAFDGSSYGYLVADAYQTYDGANTTWYRNYRIWNGTEVITVKEDASGLPAEMKAGSVIKYNDAGEGLVKDVELASPALTQVTGYDQAANKMSVVGNTATKITSDTVIFYVNSATHEGFTGGTIAIADDTSADGSITAADQANVRVLAGTGDKADEWEFILVDVNNKMAAGPTAVLGSTATVADVNKALSSYDNVTVTNPTFALTANVTIPQDKTLTINGNVTGGASYKFVGGGTINVNGTVDRTEALTTLVALGSGATQEITLPAVNVKIGDISGRVGDTTGLAYNGSDLAGKLLYQYDFTALSGFTGGTSVVKVDGKTISVADAKDLADRFSSSGEKHVITVDVQPDSTVDFTITVTAP